MLVQPIADICIVLGCGHVKIIVLLLTIAHRF